MLKVNFFSSALSTGDNNNPWIDPQSGDVNWPLRKRALKEVVPLFSSVFFYYPQALSYRGLFFNADILKQLFIPLLTSLDFSLELRDCIIGSYVASRRSCKESGVPESDSGIKLIDMNALNPLFLNALSPQIRTIKLALTSCGLNGRQMLSIMSNFLTVAKLREIPFALDLDLSENSVVFQSNQVFLQEVCQLVSDYPGALTVSIPVPGQVGTQCIDDAVQAACEIRQVKVNSNITYSNLTKLDEDKKYCYQVASIMGSYRSPLPMVLTWLVLDFLCVLSSTTKKAINCDLRDRGAHSGFLQAPAVSHKRQVEPTAPAGIFKKQRGESLSATQPDGPVQRN